MIFAYSSNKTLICSKSDNEQFLTANQVVIEMRFIVLPLLLTLLSPNAPAEPSKSAFPYMAEATNRITAALSTLPSPGRDALVTASSEACASLTRLLKDGNFYKGLDNLAQKAESTASIRSDWKNSQEQFQLAFIPIEEKAFRNAGLDEVAIADLLAALKEHHKQVAGKFDQKAIIHATEDLKESFCTSAKKLQAAENAAEELAKAKADTEIWKWRWRGIAIVTADVGFELLGAVVGGPAGAAMAAPVSVGSCVIGGSMMTWTPTSAELSPVTSNQ